MGAPEVFLVCQGCLSDDRRCNVIDGNNLNIFLRILDPDGDCKPGKQDINCLFLCWECDAMLKKIKEFQLKVQKARIALKKLYLPTKSQSLSTLKVSTKTEYDAVIDTSLQFKEITITKIGADGKPISDNVHKNNNVFDKSNQDFEFEVSVNSPVNYGFSDNDYNSDHMSDDEPIIELKIKNKKYSKKTIKAEDGVLPAVFDPLAGRPKRKKKPVKKLDMEELNIKKKWKKWPSLRSVLPATRKLLPVPKKAFSAPKKVLPTETCPSSDDDDEPPVKVRKRGSRKSEAEKEDPTFKIHIPNIKPTQGQCDENSKYTKLPINQNNILQYFTKYTLSVPEYKAFLERLEKSPYFMGNRKKCAKCVVTFMEEDDYVQHMNLHVPNIATYGCNLCDIHYLDKQEYETHTRSHLTVQQCKICKQSCGLQHSLTVHMQTVHREGWMYKCQACSMMFDKICKQSCGLQHSLTVHMQTVYREGWMYKCQACSMMFDKICKQSCGLQHSLTVHMQTVHREGWMYKCQACSMMFDKICKQSCGLQHSLTVHMQTVHREGWMYKCQASRSAVCQHFDKLHKRLVCNECGKFQYSKKTMELHYQSKHVTPKCPHCNRRLKSYSSLKTHLILRHSYPEKNKFKLEDMYCVECDKQFNTMLKFRTHTSTVHRPDKTPIKVECKDCGKMIRKTFLRTHYDFYHGEPRFKCDICNKPFAKKESLQRHIGVLHLGQRPVKDKPCYICGRLFTTNRILTHHIRTHTGEKPFSCDYCPATFAQKAAKYIHYKNVHKRRLDNTSVETANQVVANPVVGDPRMSMMMPCAVPDEYTSIMDIGLRPVADCGVNICHSVMSGGQ